MHALLRMDWTSRSCPAHNNEYDYGHGVDGNDHGITTIAMIMAMIMMIMVMMTRMMMTMAVIMTMMMVVIMITTTMTPMIIVSTMISYGHHDHHYVHEDLVCNFGLILEDAKQHPACFQDQMVGQSSPAQHVNTR